MRCNLCLGSEFGDMGERQAVRCLECGSLERTRLMGFYLDRLALQPNSRVLHIAPVQGIYRYLAKSVSAECYDTVDLHPEGFPQIPNMKRMDLCDLDGYPSQHYDLIIHSHVLEHTLCSLAYTLWHLHRMLKSDGTHLCVIPFMGGYWHEQFVDKGPEKRIRRFGQHDHVRRFGIKDKEAQLGKLIRLPEVYDASEVFPVEQLLAANISENAWRGFHMNTVLELKRSDMLLLGG